MAEQNQLVDKAYIRKQMAIKRNSLLPEQRKLWSDLACANAGKWLEHHLSAKLMVYVSFRSELDLTSLIEDCWQAGREVIVPRCVESDRSMTLHYLRSWDDLMPGAYGIMEPNPAVTPPIEEGYVPDIVLVPGIAFDRNGGRLGYGGGYYDRFAEAVAGGNDKTTKTLWLGMSFEAQFIAEVRLEEHDLKMDGWISESGVYLL
ncbi:5-formyltetrahydrofolate cyclo-ligase [Paenibacillus sp. FJAT-27812]|uniref:5-formyltetrahydrofolate cyclo-ligase n=1 Tax=Paenibacillus sp. FJAT-27812 TaxID=1684143 RepID=UPI000B2F131B|nr:5-formyltetrahydrofolate cyclo-ligase [Paenibacillus sp. FJAT-27812]